MVARKRDAAATRQRLLQAAEELFVERGFDATRVDAVALRAGANKRMIYVYFGSKEKLYAEVLRVNFQRAVAEARPPAEGLSPAGQVEAALRSYFRFLRDNPSFVRLLDWENLARGVRAGRVLMEHAAAGLRELRGVLERGIATGAFRSELDPGRVVLGVHVLCLGWFTNVALREALGSPAPGATGDDGGAWLEHVLGLVFRGILRTPDPA